MVKIVFGGRETLPLRLRAEEKILSAGCSARGNAEDLSKWSLGPTEEIDARFAVGTVDWWEGSYWSRISAYVPAVQT